MNNNGPIIIIDDDHDDQTLFASVIAELKYKNELIFFDDGEKALDYLLASIIKPFLIISDIYMPKYSGLSIRKRYFDHPDCKHKCAPYVFMTGESRPRTFGINDEEFHQGLFVKPNNMEALREITRSLLTYWSLSEWPS